MPPEPPEPVSVAVIIPAYNEEDGLEGAVSETIATFERAGADFEIILVNDHSSDSTPALIDQLAAGNAKVRAFHHAANTGAGGAFRTGIAQTTREFVIFVPVDNPLSAEDLAPYLANAAHNDIVVGVRERRVGYTPMARIGSYVYSRILLPLVFRLRVTDPNWIQLYRRAIFTEHGIRITHTGIFFPAEILIQAQRQGLRLCEIPARMRLRVHGKATCFRFSSMWKAFRDMMDFYWKTRGTTRPA